MEYNPLNGKGLSNCGVIGSLVTVSFDEVYPIYLIKNCFSWLIFLFVCSFVLLFFFLLFFCFVLLFCLCIL